MTICRFHDGSEKMSDIKFPVHTTIFHADWEPIFADRPYGECWDLIMAMFGFMEDGSEPNFKSVSMQIAWRVIRDRMIRDIKRYQNTVRTNKF